MSKKLARCGPMTCTTALLGVMWLIMASVELYFSHTYFNILGRPWKREVHVVVTYIVGFIMVLVCLRRELICSLNFTCQLIFLFFNAAYILMAVWDHSGWMPQDVPFSSASGEAKLLTQLEQTEQTEVDVD